MNENSYALLTSCLIRKCNVSSIVARLSWLTKFAQAVLVSRGHGGHLASWFTGQGLAKAELAACSMLAVW